MPPVNLGVSLCVLSMGQVVGLPQPWSEAAAGLIMHGVNVYTFLFCLRRKRGRYVPYCRNIRRSFPLMKVTQGAQV